MERPSHRFTQYSHPLIPAPISPTSSTSPSTAPSSVNLSDKHADFVARMQKESDLNGKEKADFYTYEQQREIAATVHTQSNELPLPAAATTNTSHNASSSSSSNNDLPPHRRRFRACLLYACERGCDLFVRLLGPLLSVTAVCLISFVTYVYFTDVRPIQNAQYCHAITDVTPILNYLTQQNLQAAEDGTTTNYFSTTKSFTVSNGQQTIQTARRLLQDDLLQTSSQGQLQAQTEVEQLVNDFLSVTSPCFKSNLMTACGLYILFCIFFHYFCTMFRGAGTVPPVDKITQETLDFLIYDPERKTEDLRYCKKCQNVKPMRTHHCSVCGKCVLKMDHHCPWTNTCVGFRNHRHFICFIFYLWTGCSFFLFMAWDAAVEVLIGTSSGSFSFVLSVVIAFAAFSAGTLFLLWNLHLLVSNESTIEFYGNHCGGARRSNPYDMGIHRNIQEVLGKHYIFNLLVPSFWVPPGDGLIFPLNQGRGMPLPMLLGDRQV